ncbi:GAP family protein [Geodermatophilus sp. SYSU D00703]
MWQVLGDVLPLAVGVAIAPVPIAAVILMLLAADAGRTSTRFLAGWVVGIAGASTVVLLAAGALAPGGSRSTAAWMQLVLGILLLVLAAIRWRSRRRRRQKPLMPSWTAAIDRFGAVRTAGIGLALAAVNPKNLLLCAAAGTAIAGGDLSVAGTIAALIVFTVVAARTVAVPVVTVALGRQRLAGRLQSSRGWLTTHSDAVLITLLLVIGALLIVDGLSAA